MRPYRLTILIALFIAIQTFFVQAQTASSLGDSQTALAECLSSEEGKSDIAICFGTLVSNCQERYPNAAIVPKACWEEELFAWDKLLDASYEALIADLGQRSYGNFEAPIRDSQRHWVKQKDMDCQLEFASNPQTYDVIWPACQAEATMERVIFLQQLMGADWKE